MFAHMNYIFIQSKQNTIYLIFPFLETVGVMKSKQIYIFD